MPLQLELYADMLSLVGEGVVVPEKSFSLFPTQVGSRWQGELLVCGRAVNGYEPVWMCSDVTTDPGRRRVLGEVQKRYQEPECQLRWVEECWNARSGYNTARSAFWRLIRGITRGLGIAASRAPNWPGSLAWANLYRIAPSVTGNPSAKLRRLQLDLCSARLARDLAELRPRRLLFLTGIDWAAPFIARCDSQIETRNGLVQGYGALHLADGWRVATVIAKHPQGKPEGTLTAEVLDSFAQVA